MFFFEIGKNKRKGKGEGLLMLSWTSIDLIDTTVTSLSFLQRERIVYYAFAGFVGYNLLRWVEKPS
jgi:hypothetical protein